MPNFNKYYLDKEIEIISNEKLRLKWLVDIVEKDSKIVNFGCRSGYEALALMWILEAKEIVIVDRDISESEKKLKDIEELLKESNDALQYEGVSLENRKWWENCVPKFLKNGKFPSPKEGDLSKSINSVEENYFDLAYSSNVLYNVFREYREDGLKNAVREMKRVTKFNGLVVVCEPKTINSKETYQIDFESILSEEGLLINRNKLNLGAIIAKKV